jgi:hypothetical protein
LWRDNGHNEGWLLVRIHLEWLKKVMKSLSLPSDCIQLFIIFIVFYLMMLSVGQNMWCLVSVLNSFFLTMTLIYRLGTLSFWGVCHSVSVMWCLHATLRFCHSFDFHYVSNWYCPTVILRMTFRQNGLQGGWDILSSCQSTSDLVWCSHGWHSSCFVLEAYFNFHAMSSHVE